MSLSVHDRALLLVALLLGCAALFRRSRLAPTATVPAWTSGALLPFAAATITALLTLWIWGGFAVPAPVDDEAAYLLQGGLLARGRWSLPSPPVLQPFSQNAVLLTPVVTPKMAPGHALVLLPGILVGLPGLVPLLLIGATAGMLVLLVRRLVSAAVAMLTWATWLIEGGQWRWRASYFSETTTGVLWLVGWWAVVRWRDTGRDRWLAVAGACAGLGAITRPLTMLVWAVPVAWVVLPGLWRDRRWAGASAAVAAGAAFLLLIPIQNAATLGDWRHSPLALYREQYLPFDRLGFGLDSTPATIGLPPVMDVAHEALRERHREHVAAALPTILVTRLDLLRSQVIGEWRLAFIPALIAGVIVAGGAGLFGMSTLLLLYAAYGLYAYEPSWTLYSFEAMPIAAFLVAVGIAWIFARTRDGRPLELSQALLVCAVIVGVGAVDIAAARRLRAAAQQPFRELQSAVDSTGTAKALVIVHYGSGRDRHVNLVRYSADPDHARMLTALDLGDSSTATLLSAFPDRTPYQWDAQLRTLTPINRAAPALSR